MCVSICAVQYTAVCKFDSSNGVSRVVVVLHATKLSCCSDVVLVVLSLMILLLVLNIRCTVGEITHSWKIISWLRITLENNVYLYFEAFNLNFNWWVLNFKWKIWISIYEFQISHRKTDIKFTSFEFKIEFLNFIWNFHNYTFKWCRRRIS